MAEVTISIERLKELEEIESSYSVIQEKLKKRSHNNVERLRKYDVEHPEKAAERYKRHIAKDKEAFNAKRRERYKKQKEARFAESSRVCQTDGGSLTKLKSPASIEDDSTD
jgi:hypothetical protein